jgi:hypothetical protein
VACHFGEHTYSAEDLEPSVATFRSEQSTTSPLSAEKVTTPWSKRRTRRPAEREGKLDNAPRRSADSSDTAPVLSAYQQAFMDHAHKSNPRPLRLSRRTGSGRKLEAQD